ncbi:MAG: diguanylate cyclase [Pseudomonadota bacterium]
MFKASPSIRISAAIALLSISVLMLADLLGFFPDRKEEIIESRATAIDGATRTVNDYIRRGQLDLLPSYARRLVSTNSTVVGFLIVDRDGRILSDYGDTQSINTEDNANPDVTVLSINSAQGKWGQVGIAFEPVFSTAVSDILRKPLVRLALFLGFSGFLLYEFYLRRVLRYLDPTNIMPERVRTMIDALAEGVVLLDSRRQIVMANNAFARDLSVDIKDITKINLADYNWQHIDEYETKRFPWEVVLETGVIQENVVVQVTLPGRGRRYYSINATPIMDDGGKVRGAMITFDDQTDIVLKNDELEKALRTTREQQKEIEQQNEELKLLATRDPLTGCLNRRAFFEVFEKEFIAAKNRGTQISVIMCDIDHFKSVNDTYGHSIGDQVIKKMAEVVQETVRENDHVCRYGGEEFCTLLPGIDKHGAATIAERIRTNIEGEAAQSLKLAGGRVITSSFGVSDLESNASDLTELIDQADSALYESKENGRNQVSLYTANTDMANSAVS